MKTKKILDINNKRNQHIFDLKRKRKKNQQHEINRHGKLQIL